MPPSGTFIRRKCWVTRDFACHIPTAPLIGVASWKSVSRDFYLKLSGPLCIHVPAGNIFSTLISYHLQVSDTYYKWLQKRFKSTWLIDESLLTLLACFLNRATFSLRVLINHNLYPNYSQISFICEWIISFLKHNPL